MLDVEKNVAHWRKGATEAWEAADDLINKDRRILFGLFFVHLALEKIIKAHVWRVKEDAPPRIHNLVRLAELAGLTLDDTNKNILSEINEFNIEGRYSDLLMPPPTLAEARRYMQRAEGVFQWLTSLF
ncbi:MAG: HEPN domain-containing protein [Chloroflexi bacterium]|nr:HEPN domain-containing protein [Chloroflexota bacterium]